MEIDSSDMSDDSDYEDSQDPGLMRQENHAASDFIQFKATLIREYSRRKDALRRRYRHRQLTDEQLLAQYTDLVQWYVDTRHDLQADFPDHEWEVENRSVEDVRQLAEHEVAALIELRQAGRSSLSGGSSITDGYIRTLYGGGGARRSGRIRERSAQKKPFTGASAHMIGHDIELEYSDNGGGWWMVTVVDFDPSTKQHTVVGRYDNEIIGQYQAGGDNSSLDELRQIAQNGNDDDGYYTSVLDLNTHQWRVPVSSRDDPNDDDYVPSESESDGSDESDVQTLTSLDTSFEPAGDHDIDRVSGALGTVDLDA